MSRLAFAMSTAPLRRAAIPTPEPPPDTSTSTSGAALRYSSAQTWATLTIVSEPLFWMTVRGGLRGLLPAAAAAGGRREGRGESEEGQPDRASSGGTRVMGVSCGFAVGYSMRMPSTAPTRSRTWLERKSNVAS